MYCNSLIEAILDPLVIVSSEGKITHANEAMIKITDIDREKLIGTNLFIFFTESQKVREICQNIFVQGSVSDAPLNVRHKDGKLIDVLFNGSVYKDYNGNVLGAIIVMRDITRQKKFENELIEAKSNAEKERQIAEKAVKAKQQFLSNMSHEIRTPLNAIIGFTKVILKTKLNEKQKEYLNAIKISGDALIVLINDILDLAKVDAGKMTFEQIPFKVSDSISGMLQLFETKIHKKNIELVKEYDTSIPEVLVGDPGRLHQIILNLVSNAVKFTEKGKISVKVNLLSEEEENAIIEFVVSDTGIGIPENKLGNIFDYFQQATSQTARLYGGTGLGLAIAKQLVVAQGGTIFVKSKLGEGSTFGFNLTFKKTREKANIKTEVEMESATEVKNIKVLVVEDVKLNQLLMKTILEGFGFEIDIAGSGKAAIEKLKGSNYDIILMDLQMPEMNGFAATEYIRKKMNSQIPIIALTADVTTADVEKCRAVGMNDYLAKPINDKLLYNKIIKYINKLMEQKATNITEEGTNNQQERKCTSLDYLREHTKNDSEIISEMIKIYLTETPKRIEKMKRSIDNMDWDSLAAAAHSIIPSFSIMGINKEFEEMAKQIQEYAKKKENSRSISDLVQKIEKVCLQACKELEIESKELVF